MMAKKIFIFAMNNVLQDVYRQHTPTPHTPTLHTLTPHKLHPKSAFSSAI